MRRLFLMVSLALLAASTGRAALSPTINNAFPPYIANYYSWIYAPLTFANVVSPPVDGETAYVKDAQACTTGAPVSGGGSTRCLIYFNSALNNWYPIGGTGGINPPAGDLGGSVASPSVNGILSNLLPTPLPTPGGCNTEFGWVPGTGWVQQCYYTSAPYDVQFNFQGTPTGGQTLGQTTARTLNWPAQFNSSTFPDANGVVTCQSNPAEADDYILKCGTQQIGDISVSTSCQGSFSTVGGATQSCAAGNALTLVAPATVSGSGIYFTLPAHTP